MLSSLPEAIGILLSLEGLLVLILGTVLGIILGAMPGIGSTVAVAIVLPFTLTMGQAPRDHPALGRLCRVRLRRLDCRDTDQHAGHAAIGGHLS